MKHLSSKTGDLPEPNGGKQQMACVVFDIDQDGAADIVIAERTQLAGHHLVAAHKDRVEQIHHR